MMLSAPLIGRGFERMPRSCNGVFRDGAELARADADGGKMCGEVQGVRQGPHRIRG